MSKVVNALKTVGLSPKAVAAFAFPFVATIVGAGLDWILSGKFDVTTVRTAIAGFGAAVIAAVGAYLGKPGKVEVPQ